MLNRGHETNVLENTNDSGFCAVKDKVIDLVVAMNEGSPVCWLSARILEECDHLIEVRDLANRHASINIDSFSL